MNDIERIERRLKLHDVRVLIAVAEAGSMHKAAQGLRTSQPAISRAIADLEHAVGVRLLERSPRGIEPTPYGRALIKHGVAAFDEFRQGLKDIKFLADPSTGELHIACSDAMAAGPVLAVIEQLTRRHPRLVFHVATGSAATLLRKLAERNVELVITRAMEAVAPEQVDVARLFEDNVIVAAGAQSRWARRRRIKLDELVHEPWVLPPSGSAVGAIILEAFRARGFAPPAATVVMQSANIRAKLAASGRFLTVIPEFSLTLPGRDPSLKALPVELPDARRTMRILSLRNHSLSPLAELFIDSMRALAKPRGK
ncbi:MAG TPA: LysR family transcriptional regulator [Xanthobacteraceae bacterium]|jgi:DNA-binding transcriptional LysR family regulator